MSHWAELDENSIVKRVVVGDNNDPAGDEGYSWLVENLGGTWVKTSFNGTIRKNFAGQGFKYDSERDAFIEQQPFASWILNEETCQWEAPVERPIDAIYEWDEETVSWRYVSPTAAELGH